MNKRTIKKNTILNLVIPLKLKAELKRVAEENEDSVSETIRILLWQQLDNLKNQPVDTQQ